MDDPQYNIESVNAPPWLAVARRETGIAQYPPGQSNPRITEYHEHTDIRGYDDKASWCSSFVNWCLAQLDMPGTGSALARSWLEWGEPLAQPALGCIAVLYRDEPESWKGHVGFFLRADSESVYLLGGNQLGQVCENAYPRESVLGYRWPVGGVRPQGDIQAACEAILRSVPEWFGIEEALMQYVRDTATLPTFVMRHECRIIGFLTLREHFPQAWEIHCVAVHAEVRGQGVGKKLLMHVESWLAEHGARFLQVKTIAATSPNPHYALTRGFYERMGFAPVEVFPELWSPSNPCLQMLKIVSRPAVGRT